MGRIEFGCRPLLSSRQCADACLECRCPAGVQVRPASSADARRRPECSMRDCSGCDLRLPIPGQSTATLCTWIYTRPGCSDAALRADACDRDARRCPTRVQRRCSACGCPTRMQRRCSACGCLRSRRAQMPGRGAVYVRDCPVRGCPPRVQRRCSVCGCLTS